MDEFLKQWYGIAIFVAFDIAAAVAVICITYRWLFKRIFDLLVSIVSAVALSPLYVTVFIRAAQAKKRGELKKLLRRETFVGKKGKRVKLHTFETENSNGEAGLYGKWLQRTGFYKLARVFDLFLGRISVIGIAAFTAGDHAFLDEAHEERYVTKIGLIHPLVRGGDEDTDYADLLHTEKRYARRFSFFGDCAVFFTWLLKKIRGEGNGYLGATRDRSYAEWLYEKGEITRADLEAAKDGVN